MSVAESTPVAEILEKATSGERITDEDAVELLRSRDLVAVGRAANEVGRASTGTSETSRLPSSWNVHEKNARKPPVSSCSSRIRRKCSTRSSIVSTWPYIIVAVVEIPSR